MNRNMKEEDRDKWVRELNEAAEADAQLNRVKVKRTQP